MTKQHFTKSEAPVTISLPRVGALGVEKAHVTAKKVVTILRTEISADLHDEILLELLKRDHIHTSTTVSDLIESLESDRD
jgi:hypothetical protein